jgi:hypothetical protein
MKIRNSKAEIRKKAEQRNPKSRRSETGPADHCFNAEAQRLAKDRGGVLSPQLESPLPSSESLCVPPRFFAPSAFKNLFLDLGSFSYAPHLSTTPLLHSAPC